MTRVGGDFCLRVKAKKIRSLVHESERNVDLNFILALSDCLKIICLLDTRRLCGLLYCSTRKKLRVSMSHVSISRNIKVEVEAEGSKGEQYIFIYIFSPVRMLADLPYAMR